jgi:HEAT repeat protein
MIDAMHCPVRAIRRVSFRILSSVEALELPEVLAEAMASRDSIVRLRAARVALNHFRNEELRAKASELLRDRSAAIRLEALRTIASSFPGAIDKALQSAVLDSNAAIRNEARFLLGKIEKQDFLTMYREALTNPRTPILLAAIAGISETGTSADAKLLLPLLSHPLPRIRKTAVKFFAKLGGDDSIEQVIERLLDRSPGVSKQASQALARISAPIDATSLWRLFCESNIVHVRRNVLPLLAALPKWESITYLLLASNDDDEVIAKQARDQVLRWHSMFNRYQALPTLTQLTRLEEALLQARDLLPPHVSDLIRFSVNDLRGVLTRNQS